MCSALSSTYLFSVSGGLAEELTEKQVHQTFITFGDIVDVNMPLDYETEKHRGFAFIEFEQAEVCFSFPLTHI